MCGGWSRRKASLLIFPFPLHRSATHLHGLPYPRLSFASRTTTAATAATTITTIPVTAPIHLNHPTIISATLPVSVAAAALKGPSNSALTTPLSSVPPIMFSRSQPKTALPHPPLKHTQTSISNAFPQKPPSRYTSGLKSSCGPLPSSVPNKNAPYAQRPRPQERVIQAFRSPSSFTDSGISVSPSPSCVTSHSGSQTQMSALHAAVYFDEGDFEDDGDLDFDDSLVKEPPFADSALLASCRDPSPPLPTVSLLSGAPRSPSSGKRCHDSINNRDHAKTAQSKITPPTSSAPFPWSSSPAEHLGPPARPSSRVPTEVIDLCDEPEEAPKLKKRKIPWEVKPESAGSSSMPTRALDATSAAPRVTQPKELLKKRQYLWDMTASDLKKASGATRKRVDQRRGLTTVAGMESVRKLKQKKLTLSLEQMHVLDLVLESGKSVFFTGSAGTGKSVLMREVISSLSRRYGKASESVAVTASTGLAACNIGGITLHSFAGIGLGKESVPDLVKKIKRNPRVKSRWLRTKVLIIDEISMVDGELFDKLEAIARIMRNNGRAFGGIQLVITGDFFQLPPVPDNGKVSKFAFDADTWNTSIEHTIGLTQVFRQRDPLFAAILNEMRVGKLSESSVRVFQSLSRPLNYDDGIEATELFSTRQEVEAANRSKMRVLSGEAKKFMAEDTGTLLDKAHRDKLLANCMAPAVIELKVNSQVMLIKNMDDTLVNGSLGRVVGFMDEKTYDLVQEYPQAYASLLHGKNAEETSVPRKLGALARIKAEEISDSGKLAAFARIASGVKTTAQLWPLVEFVLPDATSRQFLVQPEQWKFELPSGEVQACRTQIPLILAWALSIHKAQGQTLERVKVDLGKVFEKGQAYVALSRATCKEGLQVLRFDAEKVMAHNKVRTFYNSLYSAAEAKKKGAGVEEYPDEEEEMMRMMGG